MRKIPHSPDSPYPKFRLPQSSGLRKQLPSRPDDELTFFSDSEEYDSIPSFPKARDGRSSPWTPKMKVSTSRPRRWGSDADTKGEDASVQVDSRKPAMRDEYLSDRPTVRRGYESSKGLLLPPKRSRETSPFQSRKKETTSGSSQLKSTEWTRRQDLLASPLLPGPSLQRRFNGMESPRRHSEMTERLEKMRGFMAKDNLDFYIVPSEDAHGSEQVAASDKRLRFISGFTGPVGHAIITQESAYLFTGPTYWLQAQREIDHLEWTLIRCGFPGAPQDWMEWLVDRVGENPSSQAGIDARMISYENASMLFTNIKNKDPDSRLVYLPINLVDKIWTHKPAISLEPVHIQGGVLADSRYSSASKIRRLREWIRYQRPDIPSHNTIQVPTPSQTHVATLISSLDSIAYLLNLRGSDIPDKQTFHGYLFVSLDDAVLFVERKKLSASTLRYMESIRVQQRNYTDIRSFIRKREWGEGKVLLSSQTSYAIASLLTPSRYTIAPSFVENMMTTNNEEETADSMRCIYPREGMSFGDFVDWLTDKLADGYSVSGYENNPDLQNHGMQEKMIRIYATKTSDRRPRKKESSPSSNRKLPSETLQHHTPQPRGLRLGNLVGESSNRSYSRSTSTVDTGTSIRPATTADPPLYDKPQDNDRPTSTAQPQDTTRHSSTSIDALDLASITRYSRASSRTESTDYGVFYTRRAYSEETIDSSIVET